MRRWIAAALLGVLALSGCASATTTDRPAGAGGQQASVGQSTDAGLAPARATTTLATMTVAQLPPEGIETLALIEQGGPFPYSKDGATFQNRERILPPQRSGFYQEYTVTTPGSDDRGARRIVAGDDGSRFYTDDHYASFREVVSG
jgi:ribonuclease T1